jgi:hypothetical protein
VLAGSSLLATCIAMVLDQVLRGPAVGQGCPGPPTGEPELEAMTCTNFRTNIDDKTVAASAKQVRSIGFINLIRHTSS